MDNTKIGMYIYRHYNHECFMHVAYSYLLLNNKGDLAYKLSDLVDELHRKSPVPLWTDLSPLYNKEGSSNG